MEPNENFWAEILQDGDSGDRVFEGFTMEELAESEQRRMKKNIATAQLVCDLENEIVKCLRRHRAMKKKRFVRQSIHPKGHTVTRG